MRCHSWFFSGLLLCAAGRAGAVSSSASSDFPATVLGNPASAPRALILDPGHGGRDSGAVVHGLKEKDLALTIARKIRERLEKLSGRPVLLTRGADEYIPLDQRVDEGRGGAAFVSLHLNQTRSKKSQGITVYSFGAYHRFRFFRRHHPELTLLPAPPKSVEQESRGLANAIVRTLRKNGFRVDSPERARFYVLKNPNTPSVLIEMGYLSNPREAAMLKDPAYQDRLAEGLAESLAASFPTAFRTEASVSSGNPPDFTRVAQLSRSK